MWHVSFRSGVATLRTAIHLLLTYLRVNDERSFSGFRGSSDMQEKRNFTGRDGEDCES